MTWVEALILGIVQGLTEFLPVSSSGHLEIGSVLLGAERSGNLLFAVVVHLATALATIVVFRKDICLLLMDILKFEWNEPTQFGLKIIISMLPVFFVAILFKDQIESFFTGNIALVGSMLLITGFLLLVAHLVKDKGKPVGFVAAFLMGIAQAFAVLPGISRSGATIAIGMVLGIEKSAAVRFSFLMVLVPILGASVLELNNYFATPSVHALSTTALIVGFLSSFVAGFLACKWTIAIVKHGKLAFFVAYCFVIGILAILASY